MADISAGARETDDGKRGTRNDVLSNDNGSACNSARSLGTGGSKGGGDGGTLSGNDGAVCLWTAVGFAGCGVLPVGKESALRFPYHYRRFSYRLLPKYCSRCHRGNVFTNSLCCRVCIAVALGVVTLLLLCCL